MKNSRNKDLNIALISEKNLSFRTVLSQEQRRAKLKHLRKSCSISSSSLSVSGCSTISTSKVTSPTVDPISQNHRPDFATNSSSIVVRTHRATSGSYAGSAAAATGKHCESAASGTVESTDLLCPSTSPARSALTTYRVQGKPLLLRQSRQPSLTSSGEACDSLEGDYVKWVVRACDKC